MNTFKFELAPEAPLDEERVRRYRRMGLSAAAAGIAAGARGHMPLSKRIILVGETTKPTPKPIQETRPEISEVREVLVHGVRMREVRTKAADGSVLVSRGPIQETSDPEEATIAEREARYRRMGLSEAAAATAARIGVR